MKKSLLAAGLAAALLAPQVAGAEGFGIVEWSAEGVAMGGARMFAEGDAANVAYNPASITKIEGKALKFSATYLSPHGEYEMYKNGTQIEKGTNRVHPAWAPGSYYVRRLDEKNWFGTGTFARYAMVSEFEGTSMAAFNSRLAKLNGISFTPVFAHKFDKKWSASVGAEINYVGLELQKNMSLVSSVAETQTKGESIALGWNAAANYAFDDKNEIGVVYRSRMTHSLEADFKMNGKKVADAYGVVTLPDTWSIGYNHKFDDKTRVELNATRTMWSTYDALDIYFSNDITGNLPPAVLSPKNWESGWRYAIGAEHKLSDKYSVMAGFAYDGSCIPSDGADFIVPTGNRRTYTIGGQYHDKKQTLGVTLGYMDVGSLDIANPIGAGTRAHTHDNYVTILGISYQRNF